MSVIARVMCFSIIHPVLLEDIEKVSRVKWMYTGISPSRFLPNFKFSKLVLWSDGTLAYIDDPRVILDEWEEVDPEDFLEKCKEMFPAEEV